MGAAVAAWVFSPKGDNQTYAPVFLPYLTLPYLPCPPLRHLCLYDLANKLTLTVFGPQTLAKHAHSLDCELLFDVGYVSFPFLSLFCVCACGKIDMADIFFILAITFLAQWHPLIAPKRADIRPDRVPQ